MLPEALTERLKKESYRRVDQFDVSEDREGIAAMPQSHSIVCLVTAFILKRKPMSHLLEFYRGNVTDSEGRLLKDIWTWDDDELEEVHDYIQWLFPLSEPSQFNPDAPLLSENDIAAFKSDQLIQANLMKSFQRILTFLGLELTSDGNVIEGNNLSARIPDVWAWPNHNWLRISRILRSLTLLGLGVQAKAFYEQLSAFYQNRRFPIPANSFQFWTDAVADNGENPQ